MNTKTVSTAPIIEALASGIMQREAEVMAHSRIIAEAETRRLEQEAPVDWEQGDPVDWEAVQIAPEDAIDFALSRLEPFEVPMFLKDFREGKLEGWMEDYEAYAPGSNTVSPPSPLTLQDAVGYALGHLQDWEIRMFLRDFRAGRMEGWDNFHQWRRILIGTKVGQEREPLGTVKEWTVTEKLEFLKSKASDALLRDRLTGTGFSEFVLDRLRGRDLTKWLGVFDDKK